MRIALFLAIGSAFLPASTASASRPIPLPCHVLQAETWGSIMGYTAISSATSMKCTYEGPVHSVGGQLRIIAVTGSDAAAERAAESMREREKDRGHSTSLVVVESQGPVVFSISLFQAKANDKSAAQLRKLLEAVKLGLSK